MGSTNDEEVTNVKGEVHELRVEALDLREWAKETLGVLDECLSHGPTPQLLLKLRSCGQNIRQIGASIENGEQVVSCLPKPMDAAKRAERNPQVSEPIRGIVNAIGAPMFRDHATATATEGN